VDAVIKVKRVYDQPSEGDGIRVLVDRLWPRGLSKERAKVDLWLKEIAPSDELRKRFCHDPARWEEFKVKYAEELKNKKDLLKKIKQIEEDKATVTLLYAAKDREYNNAIVLINILREIKI
jgi:uncharacterized protein YeaO (DUF488 family)